MTAPLLYESHCHTPLCQHASGTPAEFAAMAELRGLKGIIFTDHCPLPNEISADVRMRPEEFAEYVEMIARTREEFMGRVDVRLGLESDFYPGVESWLEELHGRVPLHHVLGSVHPQISHYRLNYFHGDSFAYQQVYFAHLALAAESGLFDTLAHPDLIKNEDPGEWDFTRIAPSIAHALDRIASTGVAMELNTSGVNKAVREINPGPRILAMIRERGIPIVLGADAHRPSRVADGYVRALELLQEMEFSEVSYFIGRERQAVRISDALLSLHVLS